MNIFYTMQNIICFIHFTKGYIPNCKLYRASNELDLYAYKNGRRIMIIIPFIFKVW